MSSPVAYVGLEYDDVDIQRSDLSVFLWVEKGIDELPQVRGEDTVVPALAGRVEGSRKNDTIQIELRGQITCDPTDTTAEDRRSSWRQNMRNTRILFASDRERADLVATLEDGTVLAISARPLNIVIARTIGSEYASLSIEMEGYDDWEVVVGS